MHASDVVKFCFTVKLLRPKEASFNTDQLSPILCSSRTLLLFRKVVWCLLWRRESRPPLNIKPRKGFDYLLAVYNENLDCCRTRSSHKTVVRHFQCASQKVIGLFFLLTHNANKKNTSRHKNLEIQKLAALLVLCEKKKAFWQCFFST